MGFTQEKDLIIYKGRKYNFTYNLTTRESQGDIEQALNRSKRCIEKTLVKFFLVCPEADGFYEAILKNTKGEVCGYRHFYNTLNPYINDIKKNMKEILKSSSDRLIGAYEWLGALKTLGLTELERLFFRESNIEYKQVLKKYAYQYSKYHDFIHFYDDINNQIKTILEYDNELEMPSNLMDFLLKTKQRYNEVKDRYINDGLVKYHNKYSRYEFSDGKYEYIIPSTIEQVQDEALQQCNCVYNSYLEQMVRDSCGVVVFVRDIDNPNKSYITLQYNDTEKYLYQCRFKFNRSVDKKTADYLLEQLNNR